MNSRKILKWHIRVFKFCGLWPPKHESLLYKFYTIIFSIFVNFGFPISQVICIFYVDSVDAIVDHLVLTSTVIMAVIKGLNVLAKRKPFIELLQLMKQMDQTVTSEEENLVFKPLFHDSDRILYMFVINYICSYSSLVLQVVMSPPDRRIWSSTYLYPVDWLHQPTYYIGGIIFQALANLLLVFVDIAVDTYGPSLLHVLGGYLDVLGEQLRALGKKTMTKPSIDAKTKLMELCKKYILIIRFSELIEEILSFALLSQFGVSGLVICTCGYQLSVVSPIEDTSKFVFSAVYSFAMVTEIFVPSYFGSILSTKSEHLTYDVFKSHWIESNTSYRRVLGIFVERTLKPISIFAGSLFALNLTTMLKILRTAYSLFALLKNVQN